MTPIDDLLALIMIEAGYTYRQAALLLKRSDKTIKAGVIRAKENKTIVSKIQKQRAKRLRDFAKWLERGEKLGYLDAITEFLTKNN